MPVTTIPTPDIEFDQKGLNFTGSPPGGLVSSYTNTGLGSTQYDANLVDGTAANLTVQIKKGKVFAQANTNVGLRLNNPKAAIPQPYTIMVIGNEFFRDGDNVYWLDDVANNVNIRSDINNYQGWAGAGPLSNNAAIGLDDAIILFTVDGANSSIRIVGNGVDQTVSGNAGANSFDLEMLYWNKDKTADLFLDGQVYQTRAWASKFTQLQSDKSVGDEAFNWGIPGVGVILTGLDGTIEGSTSVIDGGGLDGVDTLRYKLTDNSVIVNQDFNKGQRVFLHNFDGENGQAPFNSEETGNFGLTVGADAETSTANPKFGTSALSNSASSTNGAVKVLNNSKLDIRGRDFVCQLWSLAVSVHEVTVGFFNDTGVGECEVSVTHEAASLKLFISDSTGTLYNNTTAIGGAGTYLFLTLRQIGDTIQLYSGTSLIDSFVLISGSLQYANGDFEYFVQPASDSVAAGPFSMADSVALDIGRNFGVGAPTVPTAPFDILYADVDTTLDSGFAEALDTGGPTSGVPMLTSVNADGWSVWDTKLEAYDSAIDGTEIGFLMLPRTGYVGLQAMTTGLDAANTTSGESLYAADIITVEDDSQCFIQSEGISYNANGTVSANPNMGPVVVFCLYWFPSTKQYTRKYIRIDGTDITESLTPPGEGEALLSRFSLSNKVGL